MRVHLPPYQRRPRLAREGSCPSCQVSAELLAVRVYNSLVWAKYPAIISVRCVEHLYHCPRCGHLWRSVRHEGVGEKTVPLPEPDIARYVWWVGDHERLCSDPSCRVWVSRKLTMALALGAL